MVDEKKEIVCNYENTLENGVCLKVNKALKLLKEAIKETQHYNRDTLTIKKIIPELEFIVKENTTKRWPYK